MCPVKKSEDILGRTFGNLTVEKIIEEKGPEGRTLYQCRCGCEEGNIIRVPANRLLSGAVKSCGCLKTAAQRAIGGSKERRPQGWSVEDEAERVRSIYKNFEPKPAQAIYDTHDTDGINEPQEHGVKVYGVYKKGNSYVAQMRIGGRTYHIVSSVDEEVAINARHEVVKVRLEQGPDAAIAFIQSRKAIRRAAFTKS